MEILDADTMFENWLVTKRNDLARDFEYYYATDGRNEVIKAWSHTSSISDLEHYINIVEIYMDGSRFEGYKRKEIREAKERIQRILDADARAKEEKKQEEKRVEESNRFVLIFYVIIAIVVGLLYYCGKK